MPIYGKVVDQLFLYQFQFIDISIFSHREMRFPKSVWNSSGLPYLNGTGHIWLIAVR